MAEISLTAYKQVSEDLIKELVCDEEMRKEVPIALTRMERCLNHYMQFDENLRGTQVASIYKQLCNEEPKDENIHLCYILGWCYDMVSNHCTMLDDLIDDDESRFGKPTWNALNEKKPIVVVDLLLFRDVIYRTLNKYVGELPAYGTLVNSFTKMFYINSLGQTYDLLTDIRTKADWNNISMNTIHVKTKYIYLEACTGPYKLAMDLAGIPITGNLWKNIQTFQYNFTSFMIIQDDLNDSFGANLLNPICDKDIKTGKVTWLLIKAKSMATPEQWQKITESLGKDDPEHIKIVKQIYCELGVPKTCRQYLKEALEKMDSEIKNVRQDCNGIADFMKQTLDGYLKSAEYSGFDYSV